MPQRKISLIDVIKINSKKILDIISKNEVSIDETIDSMNKYCSKKTPNLSYLRSTLMIINILKNGKKITNISVTIINKLLKRKLVKIEPFLEKKIP